MGEWFLNLIYEKINIFIIIFGILLLILILWNAFILSNHKSKIKTVIYGSRKKTSINKKTGEMYQSVVGENITPENLRDYEKEFNETRSLYNIYNQLIPIFPLLGILGTVSGLMGQAASEDMDALLGALNVALKSTFWGLICAIGLKFIVAIIPGRIVDDVEIMLDNYYDKYNDTIQQKNILEE